MKFDHVEDIGDMLFTEIILVNGINYYRTFGRRALLYLDLFERHMLERGTHLLDTHSRLEKYRRNLPEN